MDFDFKISRWETITVPEEFEKEISSKIQAGEISSSKEIYAIVGKDMTLNRIEGSTETITVADNNGDPTIEILDDNGDVIFTNIQSTIAKNKYE